MNETPFKPKLMTWWQKILLFFVKERIGYDEKMVLRFKVFRKKIYITHVEVL